MRVTCNEDHFKYMPQYRPATGPCGETYNDTFRSTLCPHDELPPKLTQAELEELYVKLNPDDDVQIL